MPFSQACSQCSYSAAVCQHFLLLCVAVTGQKCIFGRIVFSKLTVHSFYKLICKKILHGKFSACYPFLSAVSALTAVLENKKFSSAIPLTLDQRTLSLTQCSQFARNFLRASQQRKILQAVISKKIFKLLRQRKVFQADTSKKNFTCCYRQEKVLQVYRLFQPRKILKNFLV